MADRPVLFSAPMVLALLAGRKTQTRRLVKRGPLRMWLDSGFTLSYINDPGNASVLPYQVGDRLWVREAWRVGLGYDGVKPRDLPKPDQSPIRHAYEADGSVILMMGKLRAPIHMPRWASRLTLTVTDVHVERLQDIDEGQAHAEGIDWSPGIGAYHVASLPRPDPEFPVLCRTSAKEMFAALWDTIHGAGAWEANPEVVALTFTVRKGNIDA